MSNERSSTGNFSNPIFADDSNVAPMVAIGNVADVDYLSQNISVAYDGKYSSNVPVIMNMTTGSSGCALPEKGSRVVVGIYNEQVYCLGAVPEQFDIMDESQIAEQVAKIQSGAMISADIKVPAKFATSKDVLNAQAVTDNHFIVLSDSELRQLYLEATKAGDIDMVFNMNSPITGRELIKNGETVFFKGKAGSKMIGLDSGMIGAIGGSFCQTLWEKKDNKLTEIVHNKMFHHGLGFNRWKFNPETGAGSIYSEVWTKANNMEGTALVTSVNPEDPEGMIQIKLLKNTQQQRTLKTKSKWDSDKLKTARSLWDINKDIIDTLKDKKNKVETVMSLVMKQDGTTVIEIPETAIKGNVDIDGKFSVRGSQVATSKDIANLQAKIDKLSKTTKEAK